MNRKWYGSLNNRLEENRQFGDEIKVGTGMTEYFWSDRHAYEVVEVVDQKHVYVREYAHKSKDGAGSYSNNWELISDESKPVRYITKRGKYWYWTVEITADILDELEQAEGDDKIQLLIFLCNNDIVADDLRAKGKITRRYRANVSFGVADYHYDYEF